MLNDAESRRDAPVLREVDPLADPHWDDAVSALPGATFFHSSAWLRTLHSAYGYRPHHLVAERGGRLIFALPLLEVRSWLTGRRAVSLPFTDEVSALSTGEIDSDTVEMELRRRAALHRWKYVETRGVQGGEAPAWDTFWNHSIDLRPGPDALLAGCKGSTRSAIRKAEHSPLRIEFSQSLDAVREFHRLLCLTRQRHGVPPQPFSFFAALRSNALATGKGFVVLARLDQEAVAGAVYLHFGSAATYKYGASDERFQQLRGNNLVMWQAISRLASDGFTHLDLGRTDLSNDGLRKFKLSWGAQERQVAYRRRTYPSGRFTAGTGHRSDHFIRLFQILPRPVSRMIGAALYKHAG